MTIAPHAMKVPDFVLYVQQITTFPEKTVCLVPTNISVTVSKPYRIVTVCNADREQHRHRPIRDVAVIKYFLKKTAHEHCAVFILAR